MEATLLDAYRTLGLERQPEHGLADRVRMARIRQAALFTVTTLNHSASIAITSPASGVSRWLRLRNSA